LPAGRPTKRTPEVEAIIFDALETGLSRRYAAALAQIDYDTLKDWAVRFPEFSAQLNAREARGVLYHARKLRYVTNDDAAQVTASKFYLATRRHDPWVQHQKTEHAGTLSFTDAVAAMESGIEEDSE